VKPGNAHESVEYLVENTVRLNELAARTAEVSLLPDEAHPVDVLVSGPCPQCHGGSVHIAPVELLRGRQSRQGGGPGRADA